MIIVVPLAVENARVRLPVVSAGIALICLLSFIGTWVLAANPEGIDPKTLTDLFEDWQERPYLQFSAAFRTRFFNPEVESEIATHRREWLKTHSTPLPSAIEDEQTNFDTRQAMVLKALETSPLRKYSLVPQRGVFQIGWLTHMFLHFGWLHLLGNMLFLYIVGPMLEDAWGRGLFAAFYLLGGLLAAASHVALDVHSIASMAGASGAIAAAMGAFSIRFATRRIALGYFIWLLRIFRGVWHVPAWLCGMLWFVLEAKDLTSGEESGVAVAAHVGGFIFGAVVGVTMKAVGLERTLVATSEADGPVVAPAAADVEQGRISFARGDLTGAGRSFESAVQLAPGDLEAQWGLARVNAEVGEKDTAFASFERVLVKMVRVDAQRALEMLGEAQRKEFKPRPALAFALAQAADESELGREMAVPLYDRTSAEPGALQLKALVRASELRVAQGVELERARRDIERVLGTTGAHRELLQRAQAVQQKLPAPQVKPAKAEAATKIWRGVLTELTEQGFVVSVGGQARRFSWGDVKGAFWALVPHEGRTVLWLDWVLRFRSAEQPAATLRIDNSSPMQQWFAGANAKEIYGAFFQRQLDAKVRSLQGFSEPQFPRFESAQAYEAALAQVLANEPDAMGAP